VKIGILKSERIMTACRIKRARGRGGGRKVIRLNELLEKWGEWSGKGRDGGELETFSQGFIMSY
jgi:hypothetical protein